MDIESPASFFNLKSAAATLGQVGQPVAVNSSNTTFFWPILNDDTTARKKIVFFNIIFSNSLKSGIDFYNIILPVVSLLPVLN